ncbi:MAG: O-antigen ligase family protein [Sphingopyxis sp.]|uniref:O-antigen ligase family protein n=1 Tax=Sphingopyxis sp. TaxID=1908224 RepID=UPI001A4C6195|nr:O-antigen ligase family protein [Sphingopyxis sp.]MBL9068896.1 O-antigen ligase family protein [Sphingopyxis sp.]
MRILGILLILISLPAFIWWIRSFPRQRKWAYFAMGILPFTMSWANLDVAFINWDTWPGFARGLVVSILDTLAIAVIVIARAPFRRLPFLGLLTAYMLAAALSMFFSDQWMSSSFYAFQLIRVILVFVAVASIAGKPEAVRWLAFGLAAGAIFQGVVTLDQRLSGAVQASGTMVHQNLLGLMLHFVTLPLIALLLAGERSKFIMLGVFAALLAVALGASRGAVAFVAVGLALLFLLSLVRRSTPHKWKIVGLGALVLMVVAPIAAVSFGERFAVAPVASGPDGERQAFERAAKAMWKDHPMGVGANQYVVVANSKGYSQNAGVIWNYRSRSATVHNIYLLTAAETGWPGLLALIALFTWPVLRGLAFAFSNRKDPRGDIVIGASVAIFAAALHCFWEWVFVVYNTQYVFVISLGIIAGTIRQARVEKLADARKKRQVPGANSEISSSVSNSSRSARTK